MKKANEPIWFDKKESKPSFPGIHKECKIFLATPVHSEASIHYVRSVLEFQKTCMKNNVLASISLLKSSLITQGRNLCVSQFLEDKTNYTHLLFIDSDIEFESETIFKMVRANKDVIAAPYPMKTIDWDKMTKRVNAELIENAEQLSRAGFTFPLKFPNRNNINCENGIVELSHAPTGCMLIKREVFEKMIKAYPEREIKQPTIINGKEITRPFFYNFFDCIHDPETKNYYGEDFGFCRLWTAIGGKCHAYVMDYVSHVGEHIYRGRIYDDLMRTQNIDEKKKTK